MKYDIAIIGGGPGGYTAAGESRESGDGRWSCLSRITWEAPA